MYTLSPTILQAIATVVAVASHPRDERASSTTIAKRVGVSPRVLEKLLQALVHSEILKSQRGRGGGYRLSRSGITVKDILVALDQFDELQGARPQSAIAREVVLPALREAEFGFSNNLDRIKVERLVERINVE